MIVDRNMIGSSMWPPEQRPMLVSQWQHPRAG
jgi:hypothetical protein